MKDLKHTISSRITIDQNKVIEQLSEKANMTKRELLRELLLEYIRDNSSRLLIL